MLTEDWPSPAFRDWMERHMPKDEAKAEPKPMTAERLEQIRELANKGYKSMPDAVTLLMERMYSSLALADAVAEIDRLKDVIAQIDEELEDARRDGDDREQAARWAGMTDAQKDEAIRQAARDVR